MSEERFLAIENKVDALAVEMRAGHEQLRGEMRTGYEDLGRQMRVLHEDVVAKIAALAPDMAPLRREFRNADAELKESIEC